MRWLLPLLVLWCVGCAAPPCGPETCDGCCSAEGECLEGVSRQTCGLSGVACAACGASQECTSRGCRTLPDAGRPDGGACACSFGCCTSDGRCAPGTTPDACGQRRTFCVACAASERCERSACTSAPCAGCIDAAGHCQPGNQDFACGVDAGWCFSCEATQSCLAGACAQNVCSATTCRGCCTATLACIASTDPGHCGSGGEPCRTCGVGQACVAGVCQ